MSFAKGSKNVQLIFLKNLRLRTYQSPTMKTNRANSVSSIWLTQKSLKTRKDSAATFKKWMMSQRITDIY